MMLVMKQNAVRTGPCAQLTSAMARLLLLLKQHIAQVWSALTWMRALVVEQSACLSHALMRVRKGEGLLCVLELATVKAQHVIWKTMRNTAARTRLSARAFDVT
jgi:hypothetical protein